MNEGRVAFIEWQGQRRARRDVIHELHAAGHSVGDIARRLGVRYQIVYQVVRANAETPQPKATASLGAIPLDGAGPSDAILVGCVSQKADRPLPARDLYVSELFRRRRAFADASGIPWWILSAEYGLVEQQTVIAPYDTKIGKRSLVDRRTLGLDVARGLERALGSLAGKKIEIHAGEEYVQTVGPTLRAAGATIVRPLEGLGFGYQLQWYGDRLGLNAEPAAGPSSRSRRSSASMFAGDGRGMSRRITERFMSGALDLSERAGAPTPGWHGMPEVIAVTALSGMGASPEAVRHFLTFNAAMDRARDADRLAQAAVRLFRDEPWTYEPAGIVERPVRDLADALRTSGVSQRHSVDAFGWRLLAETLADEALAPHARAAIYDGRADARDLLTELAETTVAGSPLFPLLSGPKIGPLWIRLLAYPGGAAISSLDVVPVAVDVQVRKVTEYLGVTETADRPLEEVRAVIQRTWAEDVMRHGAAGPGLLANTSAALDPALWFYAKWGCTFCQRAGRKLPISDICAECRYDDP
jgi:hypothetical protein